MADQRQMACSPIRLVVPELRAAHLKESSVRTYVDRAATFLRWLDGEYQPRGPN
jgi:hypothetical protein